MNRSEAAATTYAAGTESRETSPQRDQTLPLAASGAVPLVVAVTGHRDLMPAEIPRIRERVRDFLTDLQHRYADRSVGVMNAPTSSARPA